MKTFKALALAILLLTSQAEAALLYYNTADNTDAALSSAAPTTYMPLDDLSEQPVADATNGLGERRLIVPFTITNSNVPAGDVITSVSLYVYIASESTSDGILGVKYLTNTLTSPTHNDYESSAQESAELDTHTIGSAGESAIFNITSATCFGTMGSGDLDCAFTIYWATGTGNISTNSTGLFRYRIVVANAAPTPTPTASMTPTITPTPANTATPTVTPGASSTNTPVPTATPRPATDTFRAMFYDPSLFSATNTDMMTLKGWSNAAPGLTVGTDLIVTGTTDLSGSTVILPSLAEFADLEVVRATASEILEVTNIQAIDGSGIAFRTDDGTRRMFIDDIAGWSTIGYQSTPNAPWHIYQNTSIANNLLRLEQDGTGDAVATFMFTGGFAYALGIDNSDNDYFKLIANSTTIPSSPGNHFVMGTGGKVGFATSTLATQVNINGALTMADQAADPSDPAAGSFVIWQSDGTGSGDDGDIMLKITDSGGTTKTITLVDYSAF